MAKKENYDALKLENQLCFPLYAASREITKKYTPFLKKLGLTYTQYVVMLVLWDEKTTTVGSLCKKLYLDTGTLSPLVKTMEKKELLTRKRSENDERKVYITITKKGEALKEKAKDIPYSVGSCISLSPEDASNLYRILYSILDTDVEENS
ncbi:MAG: MarR family transcriptional regulator [Lachnospiraceae bacterium]|nr:MarR family transcriptional regulator [Lachnospiraceae bacterium]